MQTKRKDIPIQESHVMPIGHLLGGQPAREALRDAQLALLDSPEWGYPYVWSAFMIVGSYESAWFTVQ